jgi:hypothetical protein
MGILAETSSPDRQRSDQAAPPASRERGAGKVLFHYRDRAAGDSRKTMSLPADEFLRRFLCHVLPGGLQRIRHYGLLASRKKQDCLSRCLMTKSRGLRSSGWQPHFGGRRTTCARSWMIPMPQRATAPAGVVSYPIQHQRRRCEHCCRQQSRHRAGALVRIQSP